MGGRVVSIPEDFIDLGDNHSIQLTESAAYPGAGYTNGIVTHLTPDGQPCQGSIMFDVPVLAGWPADRKWQVISWEPLTISPSLLCACGDHGFIREGKWVRA